MRSRDKSVTESPRLALGSRIPLTSAPAEFSRRATMSLQKGPASAWPSSLPRPRAAPLSGSAGHELLQLQTLRLLLSIPGLAGR